MRLTLAAMFSTALLGSAHADGDSLVDNLGPREIAVGEALRGGATGASAIGMNPAGLPLNQELVFEGGYGYRASDQASLVGVSACDSTATIPGCFFYNYAGSSPELAGMSMHRSTHVGGSSVGYPVSPRVMLGSTVKYFHTSTDVMGEPTASGFATDLGMTIRAADQISLGVAGYNIVGGTQSLEFARAVGGGVLVRPIPILALSFDARWKLIDSDHSVRYGGGGELFLRTSDGQTGFPIRLGGLHDSGLGATYISGGVGVAGMKYGLDVAARRSVSGADETMIIASLRIYGPRMRAGSTEYQ